MIHELLQELKKHLVDYLVLVTASIVFLLVLRIVQGQRAESFLALLIFTSFYIMWGILHHAKEKTLHLKNVIEYICLSFVILLLFTYFFSLV